MADDIRIEIKGLDLLISKLGKFNMTLVNTLKGASIEATNEILETQGLRNYPPATAANRPPEPYYIRGRGTQYKNRNDGKSERYGTQFYVKSDGYQAIVGNRASYAQYLTGDKQAGKMADKGWRKLFDVAKEKMPKIQQIYQNWIDRLMQTLGLK